MNNYELSVIRDFLFYNCELSGHKCMTYLKYIRQHNIRHEQLCSRRVPGGRLNKKDGLTWYGNSHVKDKTS